MIQIIRTSAFLVLITCVLLATACKRGTIAGTGEYAYVAAQQVNVRDRLSNVYNKVAVLNNGEKVEILERQKRFARVKTPQGGEGWLELRYLVTQDIYEALEKLASDNKDTPSQAPAVTRAELNMRVEPGRKTAYLYRLKDAERVDLLRRAMAEKPAELVHTPVPTKPGEKPQPVMEDWWLVRNAQGRVGWVLGRMIDPDLPLEVAQYAEGQRIQAFRVLNEVQDGDRKVPQYVVLLNEPKDGLPYDFNQFRVFTWNVARHRYETAYRERGIQGLFPVENGIAEFDEGQLPWFSIRSRNDKGETTQRQFKLIGPIVRREPTAEEKAADAAKKAQAKAEADARREKARQEAEARRERARAAAEARAKAREARSKRR